MKLFEFQKKKYCKNWTIAEFQIHWKVHIQNNLYIFPTCIFI